MTPSTEAVKTGKQSGTSAVSSPKPKPASSPSGNLPGGGPRLAPFEAYRRTDTASSGGTGMAAAEVGMMTKPVAKKRLIAVFPGGSAKS